MRTLVIVATLSLVLAGPAFAQAPGPSSCPQHARAGGPSTGSPSPQLVAARHAMRQACAADMSNFCSNVPKGCGQPMHCLKSHRAQLSAACTSAWQNLRAVRKG
jgi:hypothetical protein